MDNHYAQSGRMMFLIAWIFLFGLLILFFYYYHQKDGSYQVDQGVLTINADEKGHYFIKGTIDDQKVEWLLDTGATLVAVPEALASRLESKGRYPILLETANGQISGSLTRLKKMTFANFTLENVKAVIIPGTLDDPVLLGMNVLSEFELSQRKGQLIIKRFK